KADFPSPFAPVLVEDPVNSDWPLFPLEVPPGLKRMDLALEGEHSGEEWDLFLYDARGLAVADTLRGPPSGNRASLSLESLPAGDYRIAVSRTVPDSSAEDDLRGARFVLTVDLVGAASPRPAAR
ncbi:MAG: hypothetical protein HY775_02020, partial [Acidobacteria bacterium]|nr:hypothetical protein [Acidobacteriota bacterium]